MGSLDNDLRAYSCEQLCRNLNSCVEALTCDAEGEPASSPQHSLCAPRSEALPLPIVQDLFDCTNSLLCGMVMEQNIIALGSSRLARVEQVLRKHGDTKTHARLADAFGRLAQSSLKPDVLPSCFKCLKSVEALLSDWRLKPSQWCANPSAPSQWNADVLQLMQQNGSGRSRSGSLGDSDDDAASTASTCDKRKRSSDELHEAVRHTLTGLSELDMSERDNCVLQQLHSVVTALGPAGHWMSTSEALPLLVQLWGVAARAFYAQDRFCLSICAEICGLLFQFLHVRSRTETTESRTPTKKTTTVVKKSGEIRRFLKTW